MSRPIFVAAIVVFLITLPADGADETTGSPPPLPQAVGENITADLVNLIFLFDRAVSKPPRGTTRNYLERSSQPSSPALSGLSGISATQDRQDRAGEPAAPRGDARRQPYSAFLCLGAAERVLAGENGVARKLVPRYRSRPGKRFQRLRAAGTPHAAGRGGI